MFRTREDKDECIACDFGKRIHDSATFKAFNIGQGFTGMKILLIAPERAAKQVLNSFCVPCEEYRRAYSSTEFVQKEYHCGDTRVLVSQGDFSVDTLEEAEIRIAGKTSW
mgnify:CR=1 FL=1